MSKAGSVRRHTLIALFAVAALLAVLWGNAARAQEDPPTDGPVSALGTFTVDNGNDAGAGSYRQAVALAAAVADGPDVINFNPGLNVVLTSGDVVYTGVGADDLTLNGNGSTINGSDSNQILDSEDPGVAVTVNDLTLTNGFAADNGGAIETDGGDVTVNNSTFSNNLADFDGGAIMTFGGNVTVNNSTFTGNGSLGFGGAISADGVTVTNSTFSENGASGGGGAISGGPVIVNDSEFTANDSGGGGGGAIQTFSGDLTVTNSTFTGNTSGGGGGALRTFNGSIEVASSTFSGNDGGGSGDGGGAILNSGDEPTTVTNSTFTGNTADVGGAIMTAFGAGTTTLTYVTVASNGGENQVELRELVSFGTVIANPTSGENCEIADPTSSSGFNYSTDGSCGLTGTGDTENGPDPQLQPLGDFGGPTQTRPPAETSPLVNAIPNAACDPTVTTDQRGEPRPGVGAPQCDIGAVELQATAPPGGGAATPIPAEPTFTG